MLDLLLAALAVALAGVVALAVLAGVTVAPFVVALQVGDARQASSARVGAAAVGAAAGGAGVAVALAVRTDVPVALAGVPLLLGWAVPPLVARSGGRWLGRAGRHEPAQAARRAGDGGPVHPEPPGA